METVRIKSSVVGGITGKLAENISKNWLIGIRETNPAILDMFKERDILPYRDFLPWSGEFAGKYITGAYYIYRLTLDKELYAYIVSFIEELLQYQAEDGYLGCYSKACRLTGAFSQTPEKTGDIHNEGTWDAWNHYHIMYGLLLWYKEVGDERYLAAVEKIADLFMKKFYGPNCEIKRLLNIGNSEMNLAPIHTFAMLYNLTKNSSYLDFALEIEKDIADERAGNYIYCAMNDIEYYQSSKPRWEGLHIIIGLAELYRATGEKYYLQTVEQIYRSILKTDIHNTGAFSTNEQAMGNPFSEGSIETCCVIAYDALAVELYKLIGDLQIIDFLEISHYNACLGFWSPTGRWSTYDTPMNGTKKASYHDVVFQSRPGSPDLNCCSVNAARGIGMITEWAITKDNSTLYINAYEDAVYEAEEGYTIEISGSYPACNEISVKISGYLGRLALRIPEWSEKTSVTVNGNICLAKAGEYCFVECGVQTAIQLVLDFSTRYMDGDLEWKGYVSLFRGPILFGTDVSLAGGYDVENIPVLKLAEIDQTPTVQIKDKICIPLKNGIILADFYHLGVSGSQYRTWIKVE